MGNNNLDNFEGLSEEEQRELCWKKLDQIKKDFSEMDKTIDNVVNYVSRLDKFVNKFPILAYNILNFKN